MGMLSGFFDDTGTHPGSKVLAVAGYLGVDPAWRLFEQEWAAFLHEFKIRPMFHMTDFASRAWPYTKWPEQKYDKCIAQALEIIDRHSIIRVSCATKVLDYTSVIKGLDPTNPNIVRAYSLCALACMYIGGMAMRLCGFTEDVVYVFAAGEKRDAEDLYSAFPKGEVRKQLYAQYQIGMIIPGDMKKVLPLQAADILAQQTNLETTYRLFDGKIPVRIWTPRLYKKWGLGHVLTATQLKDLGAEMKRITLEPPK